MKKGASIGGSVGSLASLIPGVGPFGQIAGSVAGAGIGNLVGLLQNTGVVGGSNSAYAPEPATFAKYGMEWNMGGPIEVEGGETLMRPNGTYQMFNGPSHMFGGIPYNPMMKGEFVFSDTSGYNNGRLTMDKSNKTFAELSKNYLGTSDTIASNTLDQLKTDNKTTLKYGGSTMKYQWGGDPLSDWASQLSTALGNLPLPTNSTPSVNVSRRNPLSSAGMSAMKNYQTVMAAGPTSQQVTTHALYNAASNPAAVAQAGINPGTGTVLIPTTQASAQSGLLGLLSNSPQTTTTPQTTATGISPNFTPTQAFGIADGRTSNPNSLRSIYNRLDDNARMGLATTAFRLPSVAYNLFQGLKPADKETLRLNREGQNAINLMSDLKYDPRQVYNRINEAAAIGRNRLDNQNISPFTRMALGQGITNSAMANQADANLQGQQLNNQYRAQEAQTRFMVGAGDANERIRQQTVNAQNKAARAGFMQAGLNDIARTGDVYNNYTLNKAQINEFAKLMPFLARNFEGDLEAVLKFIKENNIDPINYKK